MAIIKKFIREEGTLPHYIHYAKEYGSSSKKKKKKIEMPYDPGIPVLGIYLEKNIFEKIHALQSSFQHYLHRQDMEAT